MRIVLTDFMSLDGVVQAPGGPEEDTDGGFAHGGWSFKFFDPEVMGPVIDEGMDGTDALLFGRRRGTGDSQSVSKRTRHLSPLDSRRNMGTLRSI